MAKILIVDDDPRICRSIADVMASMGHVSKSAGTLKACREQLVMEAYDLVFLDIQMPGLDGFDVLRALKPDEMPAIVFVTAFDSYAIQAFEANALDYLLKPIEDDRLADALDYRWLE